MPFYCHQIATFLFPHLFHGKQSRAPALQCLDGMSSTLPYPVPSVGCQVLVVRIFADDTARQPLPHLRPESWSLETAELRHLPRRRPHWPLIWYFSLGSASRVALQAYRIRTFIIGLVALVMEHVVPFLTALALLLARALELLTMVSSLLRKLARGEGVSLLTLHSQLFESVVEGNVVDGPL